MEAKKFKSWHDLIPAFKFDQNLPFFQIMVPTSDTIKYGFILNQLVNKSYNTLIIGETGVGKSIIIQNFLNNLNIETHNTQVLNFSA